MKIDGKDVRLPKRIKKNGLKHYVVEPILKEKAIY